MSFWNQYEWLRKSRRGAEYVASRTPLVDRVYWRYSPAYYRWAIGRRMHQKADFEGPINPIKIVWVDPDQISRISRRTGRNKRRYQSIGSIKAGQWDKTLPHRKSTKGDNLINGSFFSEDYVEDTVFFKSLNKRFRDGEEWKETLLFKRIREALHDGESAYRDIKTEKDLKNRFDKIDELYCNINQSGYRAQYELVNQNGLDNIYISYLDILSDEITVDIGRSGEMLFVDGRHRLIIAKILNISRIPITILTRHAGWLNKRSKLYDTDSPLDHPDLAEMASFSGRCEPLPTITPNQHCYAFG